MREHRSLVARSVLSLSSSLVHGGLELSIMNTSCYATSRPRSKYHSSGWNIINQVETATFLERFITNMQRERSEVNHHHPWFQSLELFQGRLPYFHQWHKDAGAESHTKIQNYRWRYVSIYVKSVKSLIKLLPFHRYCRHWKVITIYYSFREDGLANNQTEREHGDVQVKVAIPGNILYNKRKSLIL